MKRTLVLLFSASLLAVGFSACKKEAAAPAAATAAVDDATMALIKAKGFSTEGVQRLPEGYLVEGDIVLRDVDLRATPGTPNLLVANEEQYRTFNLVNATNHPLINVALDNSSAPHQAAFVAALDEAIRRYNAESLTIRFQRVSSGADITVVAFYENSNVLGSAGFPTATGDPYNQIRMNTFHYSTSTTKRNIGYIGTIIAHEMGHCIGMRHTDYMNRSYSCGGFGGNEGASNVGAVHIPGTPTGPDAKSWMLACIGGGNNRPFNANDKIALNYLY